MRENPKKVVILGASGHARVIADIISLSNDEIIGFLDDNLELQGKVIYKDKKVLGTTKEEYINKYKDYYFIIGIGSNKIRKLISEKYPDLKLYTAIHPSSVIGSDVEIGEGTVIMPGTVINIGTKIGKHCIINTMSSLDHDNVLEDYVHISPGAHLAGTVRIGESTWICSGVTIINNITIADNNIIGAGGTVIKDILDSNGTYVGVPIRKIK